MRAKLGSPDFTQWLGSAPGISAGGLAGLRSFMVPLVDWLVRVESCFAKLPEVVSDMVLFVGCVFTEGPYLVPLAAA